MSRPPQWTRAIGGGWRNAHAGVHSSVNGGVDTRNPDTTVKFYMRLLIEIELGPFKYVRDVAHAKRMLKSLNAEPYMPIQFKDQEYLVGLPLIDPGYVLKTWTDQGSVQYGDQNAVVFGADVKARDGIEKRFAIVYVARNQQHPTVRPMLTRAQILADWS